MWRGAAAIVCEREALQLSGEPVVLTAGWFPAVGVTDDAVVKFYAMWKDGHETIKDEWGTLHLLRRDPSLSVNRPLARSETETDWRYIVLSRISGEPVIHMRDRLEEADLTGFVGWLGRFLNRLHRVPLSREERTAAWPMVRESVVRRHRRARELVASYGTVPARLIDQIDAWMPPVDELLRGPEELVVTHGELNDRHVMGVIGPEGMQPTGVIDFGLSGIGHPLDDLGPVWWFALRADRRLTEVFLSHAGLPGRASEDFPRHALAWAFIHPVARFPIPNVEAIATLDDLAQLAFGRSTANQPASQVASQGPAERV